MPYLSRGDWYKAIGLAVLVLAFACQPYVLGYLVSSPALTYSGGLAEGQIEDYHSHLAKMQQGARGEWRYRLLFTPEEQRGAYLQTFYVALGHLSRLSGLSLVWTYHLARLLFGGVFLVSAYIFLAFFLRRGALRWIAYLLTCFSSGLGWLVEMIAPTQPGGISPIDFWFIDAYTFFTVLTYPHFCLSVAALLWTFLGLLIYFRSGRFRYVLGAALAVLVLGVVHPFAVLIVYAVMAVYLLLLWALRKRWPWREGLSTALVSVAPTPVLAYYYLAFRADPVLRAWQAQNLTPSPPPIYYVWGYGLVLFLALPGAYRLLTSGRGKEPEREKGFRLFPLVWIATVFVLSYLPLPLQRRMIEGAHIPLCLLASVGLVGVFLPAVYRAGFLRRVTALLSYDRRRARLFLLNLIVTLTFLSNLYLLTSISLAILMRYPPLFYTGAENEAVDWLEAHSQWTDTVLSSYKIGSYLPARIGHRVFWGHWTETIHLAEKEGSIKTFFDRRTDDQARLALLNSYGLVYLFYGPGEKALGDFQPQNNPYLVESFANQEVVIFRVRTPR